MSDPGNEETGAEAPLAGRARPGLQGASGKTALVLILIGLLPVLAVPVALLPLAARVGRTAPGLSEQVTGLHTRAEQLATDLHAAQKRAHDLQTRLGLAQHQRDHRQAVDTLVQRLETLVEAKPPEQLREEQAVAEAMKDGPFDEVALIEVSSESVVMTRSATPAGKLARALPDLAARWAPDRPSPKAIEGWSWRTVGPTGYLVAVKGSAPAPAGKAPAVQAIPPVPPALEEMAELNGSLSNSAWALAIGLPLFALLLAGIGLWWIRLQVLVPVRGLTRAARSCLESPGQLSEEDLLPVGLVADLAASLLRLDQRVGRLGQLEQSREHHREHLRHLRAALERAADGKLGLRVTVQAGELEELGHSVNRLLESTASTLEALRAVGLQVREASDRLRPVAGRLRTRMAETEPERGPEPGALGDLLGTQVEGLCEIANRAAQAIERDAPEGIASEDLEEFKAAIAATQNGFTLLRERIDAATAAAERITALRRDAEVLSTNLAISAEAKSPTQLERLVDDARNLSRSMVDLSNGLGQSLGQLSAAGQQVSDAYLRSAVHLQQAVRQLIAWAKLRRSLERMGEELARRTEVVRPSAASLGTDLRTITASVTQGRKIRRQLEETLTATGQATDILSETVTQLLAQLERLDTGNSPPGAVTQRLAKQQRALAQAIQELAEVAAAEGIEALATDTRQILDGIQSMAEAARERILKTPGPEAPKPPPAEPEA